MSYTVGIVLAMLCCGCQQAGPPKSQGPEPANVPYVNADQLPQVVAIADKPVLVEFCVPLGCARCDQMRAQIDQLAADNGSTVDFYRINLNSEQSLAKQLGLKICPSYVLFDGGEPVGQVAYPTSGDLLAGELYRVVQH